MKKNAIKMPNNFKALFTIEDMEAIKDFYKNNEDCILTDAVSVLENAIGIGGNVLNYSAEWCLNSRANKQLGASDLDVCLEAYIFHYNEHGTGEIEYISICLTDIWEINGDNWDEIHERAYTRHFVEK